MPATLDDLAASLRQYFADRFPLDGNAGPGSVLLVFDNLGRPMSPREFTGSDTGPARDFLSHQRAADLADQLPAANALQRGWYLPKGGSRLSRWYASLLRGAAGPPLAAGDDLAAFEAAKAAAVKALDLNQLIVLSGSGVGGVGGTVAAAGTFDTYFATSMSPADWFTDGSTSWSTYAIEAAEQPAADAPPLNWLAAQPAFEFLVVDDPPLPDLVEYVLYATETEPDIPPPEWELRTDHHVRLTLDAPASLMESPHLLRAVAAEDGVEPGALNRSNLHLVSERSISPGPDWVSDVADIAASAPIRLTEAELTVDPSRLTGAIDASIFTDLALDRHDLAIERTRLVDFIEADAGVVPTYANLIPAQALQRVVATVADAATPTPATSSQFAVSFEYCLVRFDRPWWDDIFLHRRDWRVPGYEAGQISSGSFTQPEGEVTLITIGMLVIRNLTISANWSSADLNALQRSTSLGPFCIAASEFDQASGSVTRKGLQAIGWLCQIPPQMPPRT